MGEETLLLNPGPVVLDQRIQDALAQPMISHRSKAFEAVYDDVRDGFRYVYTNSRTDGRQSDWDGEIVLMNSTATLGMDAGVANFVGADDSVLACINGNFGLRFAQIAERHAAVDRYEIPWGESFDVDALTETIQDGDYDMVTMVHTETSTGLRNPIHEVGPVVAETDTLFVVDGVSSIGGERIHPADWSIDVSVVDAQKAVAASPGVCSVFLSQKAIDRLSDEQTYFYGDLHRHLGRAERSQTPFTSAVTLFYGLQAAHEIIQDLGMDAWLKRHERYAAGWERAATAMGLELFARPSGSSDFANTVTAINLPDAVRNDPEPFFAKLREQNVFVGGGHAHLSGDIFRLGTMGSLEPADLDAGLVAIGNAFAQYEGLELDIEASRDALADTVN